MEITPIDQDDGITGARNAEIPFIADVDGLLVSIQDVNIFIKNFSNEF